MLYQKIQELLAAGHGWEDMLYLNFEDERLSQFSLEDFDLILEVHAELYGKRPMLFLDEIQNVSGWEKFARRLADAKYSVWITGSNAKMLSSEVMGTLGGRYLATEVYPYSFTEYLERKRVPHDEVSLLGTESRAAVAREWNEYLAWGGLPEAVGASGKRDYLNSVYQKIYVGDIAVREKVASPSSLRLMIRKLTENVGQPVSYTRLAHVLSSVSGKITVPTVRKYVEGSEEAWLLLRLRNLSAAFAERESSCKYYFVDNGILNLFLIGGEAQLLENAVALALFRKYGHDSEADNVFFYRNRETEVDFYVPRDELAVQVSFSLLQSDSTREREFGALEKFPKAYPCKRRIILTNDETDLIEDRHGTIEVMPAWQWMLENKV
ncbi:MAG: ATP-binding protein [Sutterellaceae bacterium]|nr:ATP-binding protein [Sutterellaceae bacterium]